MKSWQISPFLQKKKKNVMLSKMFLIIFFMEWTRYCIHNLPPGLDELQPKSPANVQEAKNQN